MLESVRRFAQVPPLLLLLLHRVWVGLAQGQVVAAMGTVVLAVIVGVSVVVVSGI